MAHYSLTDKVALITGAGRGLGAATAVALARRGARVLLADIDPAGAKAVAATLPKGRGLALECDVTHLDSVADTLLSASPEILTTRIRPESAAEAIADGLERRQASVTVPARWRPVAALRGVAGPIFDARLARDATVRTALAHLDNR